MQSAQMKALQALAVIIPEIGPLIPQIDAALSTGEKINAIIAPVVDRADHDEPYFLEAGEAVGHLMPLLKDIGAGFAILAKVVEVVQGYQVRIEKVIA